MVVKVFECIGSSLSNFVFVLWVLGQEHLKKFYIIVVQKYENNMKISSFISWFRNGRPRWRYGNIRKMFRVLIFHFQTCTTYKIHSDWFCRQLKTAVSLNYIFNFLSIFLAPNLKKFACHFQLPKNKHVYLSFAEFIMEESNFSATCHSSDVSWKTLAFLSQRRGLE